MTSPPHDGNGPRGLRPEPRRQAGPEGHGLTAGCTAKVTNGKPGTEPSRARLRILVCGFCSTAEVVRGAARLPTAGTPNVLML
jgi:hypothetical protein